MRTNNNSVESVLSEIFFDDYELAITKLKEYDLYEITEKHLDYYFKIIEIKKASNFNVVYVTFVQSVNSIFKSIDNSEEVEFLKYLLSSIGNYLIDELIKKKIISIVDLKNTRDSLMNVYDLQGFDYNDFEKRTHLNRIVSIYESQNINLENQKFVHYEWLGDNNLFDEISRNLKSKNYIKSIKNFKSIFTTKPVNFFISKNYKEFIVILFDLLYERKIIKPKVMKGHLAPLKLYARDFENNLLYKKEMKHIKFTLKNNPAKYHQLRAKAEKWLLC